MWRRTYLLLLFVRIYLALSPSYLHPDENFQGPEVIAGKIFPYPSHRTWEWTSARPIRSVFPLWPVYGLPMTILTWIWAEEPNGIVSPEAIYYALRVVMFMLSFVLEDWAIFELVHSPRHRSDALSLVASSYVTWTFQTHTFSNSIETLLVAWSLVLIDRITSAKHRSPIGSCIALAFCVVFGFFNRVTFPAFILIPGLQLLPHFLYRPFTFVIISVFGVIFTILAVATDTAFYAGSASTTSFRALFSHLYNKPIITPLNNVRYNSQSSNLALHGLHPHYQHFLVNLPQLLGPALIALITSSWPFTSDNLWAIVKNPRLTSAITGTFILSVIPHQEPRFLLPCIPLLLTCIRLPSLRRWRQTFWISWIIFNAFMGILMGIYHQGGVVPAQIAMPHITKDANASDITVFWWKTYPPPTYLLGAPALVPNTDIPINMTTVQLMGLSEQDLREELYTTTYAADCQPQKSPSSSTAIFLAAPLSAHLFDSTRAEQTLFLLREYEHAPHGREMFFSQQYVHHRHINLDDMDFADDGVFGTLDRVVGRRGISVWRIRRICNGGS